MVVVVIFMDECCTADSLVATGEWSTISTSGVQFLPASFRKSSVEGLLLRRESDGGRFKGVEWDVGSEVGSLESETEEEEERDMIGVEGGVEKTSFESSWSWSVSWPSFLNKWRREADMRRERWETGPVRQWSE